MARVANRHLSGTLATPNRLLRFPVVTTEPPTHVDVVSALAIACHEEIFIFPFFFPFFFLKKYGCITSYFSRWKRTFWRGGFQRIETVNFFPNPFLLFPFHFFFLLVWRMYTDFKKLIRSWGWITEDFESRGIKSGSFVSMTKYFWMRWNLTGIFHRESRGDTRE